MYRGLRISKNLETNQQMAATAAASGPEVIDVTSLNIDQLQHIKQQIEAVRNE